MTREDPFAGMTFRVSESAVSPSKEADGFWDWLREVDPPIPGVTVVDRCRRVGDEVVVSRTIGFEEPVDFIRIQFTPDPPKI